MRKLIKILFVSLFAFNLQGQEQTITVFDEILFYDGYATVVNHPTPDGIIRHRNDLYSRKLSIEEIESIGSELSMSLIIKAACDNYDRIGNINLAFVPKGETTYTPENVQRIELARYITPFMNKNIQPDEVPYNYQINNVAQILKDEVNNQLYDFWVELQVFGVPYAANTQVAGCSGRNDVFFGSLVFTTNQAQVSSNSFVLPLNFQNNLNDYQEGASDAIGQTKRTVNFDLATNLTDAKLYLITSNHGANSGGEEYIRRFHYIYFDENLVLSYKPGEPSCEPYRIYNTQGNGIYGQNPMTDNQWQSFSNWCPGAAIPIREISLGDLNAGQHKFVIHVPTAVFAGNDGNFPVSLYLQGTRNTLGTEILKSNKFSISPNPTSNKVNISGVFDENTEIKIYDVLGNLMFVKNNQKNSKEIILNIENLKDGSYFLHVLTNDRFEIHKLIKY